MQQIPVKLMLALSGLALVCGSAAAQTIYRIVGPDGRVSFSDQPPPVAAPGKAAPVAARGTGGGGGGPPLPYELQQVAGRYPVTLYTGPNCGPCNNAKNLLTGRGIPFSERTVNSNEDLDALQRISGDTMLPFGSIGGQQLKGFSDVEWTQFLDAAGYPKTSVLPANFRASAATPLVAVKAPDAAPATTANNTAAPGNTAAAAKPAAARPAPAAPARSDSNPTGITF